MIDRDLQARLRRDVADRLLPLLQGAKRVALIDFPKHANIGDSMIWLGQYDFLKDHGIEVSYVTSPHDYCEETLRRCTSAYDPILIQGGGNLGDLWTVEQKLRETVIESFHDRRIIQLPQSIRFQEEENLQRAKKVFLDHPDFTLMVRDKRTHQLAADKFEIDARLAPDMALCMRELKRPKPQFNGVVWLGRTDTERGVADEEDPTHTRIEAIDWATAPNMPDWSWAERLKRMDKKLRLNGRTMELRKRLYLSMAEKRLQRGIEIVARGNSLVTERLHGHILAFLLGLPHVVVDNSYGKTSAFHEAWTAGSKVTHFASSRQQAAELAIKLADSSC